MSDHCVMVSIVGNAHSKPVQNLNEADCIYTLEKCMNLTSLSCYE